MRKIALFTLAIHLMIGFAATSMAVSVSQSEDLQTLSGSMCPLGSGDFQRVDDDQPDRKAVENFIENADSKHTIDTTKCGISNPSTFFVEKSDCTKDNKIITEINEPLGPDVLLENELDAGNEIKTLYSGVCCLVSSYEIASNPDGEVNTNTKDAIRCEETRTIYTETFDACQNGNGITDFEGAAYCSRIQWIIGTTGAGIIKVYVKQMYTFAAGLIGFLAVVTMVVSGLQITFSGVQGDITEAKQRITKAILAIVLLFLSGLILFTINPGFFGPG